MSAPPGRSATVTSLSGRVNALKFMQRASPSSTPTKSTSASTSRTSIESPSPAESPAVSASGSSLGPGGAEEEQWSLSPAAIAKLRARAKGQTEKSRQVGKGLTISQEAGFDAWLITREKELSEAQDTDSSRKGQRQTFGKLGKQKEQDDDDDDDEAKKRARSNKNQDQEPDFESTESEQEQPKEFIKPGTLNNKSSKRSLKDEASPSAKKAKKTGHGGGKKDQDKVVFARKRGGKLGISGGGR